MKLRARRIEKKLLRLHKAARRSSEALKREDAAGRRRTREAALLRFAGEFLPWAVWPVMAIFALPQEGKREAAFAIVAFHALGIALQLGIAFTTELREGTDLALLGTLPATDSLLFDRAWRRLARRTLYTSAPFLWLVWHSFGDETRRWQLGAAVLIVAVSPGLAMACAAIAGLSRSPLVAQTAGFIQLVVVGCFIGHAYLPGEIPGPLRSATLILPGSWLARAIEQVLAHGDALGVLWLSGPLVLMGTLPATLRRLRRQHRITELEISPLGGIVARFESEPEQTRISSDDLVDLEAARDDGVGTGATLPTPDELRPLSPQRSGPIERWVMQVLNRREKVLCEFLTGAAPGWTALWKTAAVGSVGGFALGFVPTSLSALSPIVMCFGALTAAPAFGGIWPGLGLVRIGTRYSPLLAPYPIGYGEACRMMLKTNAVRFACALPLAMFAGFAMHKRMDLSAGDGVLAGSLGLLIVFALQPAMLVFKFSRGTNDLERPMAKVLGVLGLLVGLSVTGYGAVLALSGNLASAIAGLAVISLPTWSLLLGYGFLYRRPIFDLVCLRTDEPSA